MKHVRMVRRGRTTSTRAFQAYRKMRPGSMGGQSRVASLPNMAPITIPAPTVPTPNP